MEKCTLFTALLEATGVPHTNCWSDQRFESMPFNSLFGLTRLLATYGIDSEGLELSDKSKLRELDVPFLAQTDASFVVVTDMNESSISFTDDEGIKHCEPTEDFMNEWSGVVLRVFPEEGAREPRLESHKITEAGAHVMRVAIWVVGIFLIIAGLIARGTWHSPTILGGLTISGVGIYISRLLLLKSLGVKSEAADRVCGAVEEGGCDDILSTEAAKFFGLFGWSEVGAAYFTVTFVMLLVWPGAQTDVALINVCCLPFSFWSIWYQRFRAHSWCTLCLTVQALLWLLAASQLPGHWWRGIEPLSLQMAVLIALYAFALLSINAIDKWISKTINKR